MTTRIIAENARSLDMIERWAELSLEESRLRRQQTHSPWTVALVTALVAVIWTVGVYYATGG